jgi:hypothetical protein
MIENSYHHHSQNKLDSLYKENFFTPEELNLIWKELEFLNNTSILESPLDTGTAFASNNTTPLKRNSGIFLDRIFIDYSKHSSIYKCVTKVFQASTCEYANLSFNNTAVLNTTKFNILVSYYDHGDCYEEHHDVCVATCLFWFYKEPKQFSGGELIFPRFNKTFPPKNNSLIMFPSHAKHLVTPVEIDQESRGKGLGRYCVSLFLTY